MGLNEKKKRQYLINIIESYLKTNIALMEYYKASADTSVGKRTCSNSIRSTQNAINHLRQIEHTDLLDYLYSALIGNNAIAYAVSGKLVLSKKIKYYDTEKGHKEFLEEMEEQRIYREKKEQEKKESLEAIKKAKELGKKVEMVYDKESKTVKPLIVEEKPNA